MWHECYLRIQLFSVSNTVYVSRHTQILQQKYHSTILPLLTHWLLHIWQRIFCLVVYTNLYLTDFYRTPTTQISACKQFLLTSLYRTLAVEITICDYYEHRLQHNPCNTISSSKQTKYKDSKSMKLLRSWTTSIQIIFLCQRTIDQFWIYVSVVDESFTTRIGFLRSWKMRVCTNFISASGST